MRISRSGNTYVLSCRCDAVNLSFCDEGVRLSGRIRCTNCGTEAEWGNLIEDCDDPEPEAKPEAEIHVLHP